MKKNNQIENHFVQGSGFNEFGNVPLRFPIRSNQTEIIFSDEAPNHNKTLIQIKSLAVEPFPPFPLQVLIFTKGNLLPIVEEVEGSTLFGEGNTRIFQVEDLWFLAVRFNDEVGQREAAADIFIQKTFCIDC